MDKKRKSKFFFFFLFYICVCNNNFVRNVNENYDKLKNECKNILPFYLNNPQHSNLLNEINISNNYSIRWNVNYLYFEYFNNEIFINFYLHSTYIKNVELYEYTHKNVLITKKDAINNEIKFIKIIEFDKSMNENKKRTFYFVINTSYIPNNDICVNIILEMNIRTIDNLKDKKIKTKKNKLPLHNKNYIIIKDNYYYVSNDDYNFNINETDDYYMDDKYNKIVIIYSILFFIDFNKHTNITFFSLLTHDVKNFKNIFFELKKVKLSKSYLHNMSIERILKYAYDDKTCNDKCIESKHTKNGIFLHTLLENNYVYKFQIKYKIDSNKEENITTNYNEYIHFNLEYSIIHNSNDYSFVDYIRERFDECIHNSFLPNKIIQTKEESMSSIFSNKKCYENKNNCSLSEIDEFIIYGKIIELNDNFILNFDSVNLFEEDQKINIIINEDSLFNFSLTSKSENIYINLLKKNDFENVCNTYYLNNINDYNLYDYIKKDKTNFLYKHFNDTFHNEKEETHNLKIFPLENIIYINCVLKKGEYDLRITVESFNMICSTNEINLLIHPLQIYEEKHKCDRMNEITELFYYHLNKENKEEINKSLDDDDYSLNKSEFKTYYNLYEKKWILNNPFLHDYDFIVLYERNIIENIDELVITINNSVFLDIFFVIVEIINGESYYSIYKESRKKTKYKLKYYNSCSIYIITPNLHYEQKDLCGFFFVDIEFINTKHISEKGNLYYNNTIEKINYIPNFIIGYDNYLYSNFCYIPFYKRHSLTIYLQDNSIIKINCFTDNYIHIYVLDKEKKIYDGYNHIYLESFTRGEYEVIFEFNSENDKNENYFFYLQIYIYHLSYLDKCIFNDTNNSLNSDYYLKDASDSFYDLSSYRGYYEKENFENKKNFFFYENQNSYYLFKRIFLFLYPNKKTVKSIKLPNVNNFYYNTFFLKIELIFHKNFLPYKMTLGENKDNFLIHSSNSYKNKIIMIVNILNNDINLFKLHIELYEDIDKNLENNYCSYAYLNITYINEIERSEIIFDDILNYNTIKMPLLLNNIFLKNYNAKDEHINDDNNSNKIEHEKNATISFKNPNSFIFNQSINYFFQIINNNTTILLVENNSFFIIYHFRENYDITLKIFKYLNNEKLENEGIIYDEINKDIPPESEEIFSFSNKHIYISTYLEKGVYIFKYENNFVPFFVKFSIIWKYEDKLVKEQSYLRKDIYEKNLINSNVKDALSSYDFSNNILKNEIYYFFDKELQCDETKNTFYYNKNLDSITFFLEEIMNKKLFKTYEDNNMEAIIRNNYENLLVYKRFYICLNDRWNNNYSNANSYSTNNSSNNNYKLFNMTIEVYSQIYIEIKPHFYLFIYPFHLSIRSKDSYFKIFNRDKNFITTDLDKGEYEIYLSFPSSKDIYIKNIIFDLIILFIVLNNKILPNVNESNSNVNILTKKYVHNDNCKINSYKYLFNKVNLVDINKNDYSINRNVVISKFKNKYFQNFDKYFISNFHHEIFFTIPEDTYFLKIFFVFINEHIENIDEENKEFSNFYDFSSNYMNHFLKMHNTIRIRVILDEEKLGDIKNEFENEEDNSYVKPLYSNENEKYMLNLYKIKKNFKILIQSNNVDCNYFKLILILYPINFYNELNHYNDFHYIDKYFNEIFDTLSKKIKKYEGIIFNEKKMSNYSYINLNTEIVFLRHNNHQNFFTFPLKIEENCYFKINIGYNFSLVSFDIKLIKNNTIISNSNKMAVNLDNYTINIFENISLYLEKGNYQLEIYLYDLIENATDLHTFNFPFYLELQIIEFINEKNNNTFLLDVFPHNSIYIDKNYTFYIDLIFWGKTNENIYLEDYKKNILELKNKRITKYRSIEVYKITLLTEEMTHIEQEFSLKFDKNINLNEEIKKKLKFTFLNDDINQVDKKNYNVVMNKEEKAKFFEDHQIYEESKNDSFLIKVEKENVEEENKNNYYSHKLTNQEGFYDVDKIVLNYRFNEEKEKNNTYNNFNESLNNENNNKHPSYIDSYKISSTEKDNIATFIFILTVFCITCAFIFLLIKLYKHWRYYKNYNIINGNEETINLFNNDDL
ncbi:conserved Plasmodium protein, unknown function [Plasmodium gallinaceum]|uniref:Cysteine repeat modular protein 4 n=1 Tax=Plasmodium gallinaceum TaxID=5849 RepID=A0A1J1GLI2_PLAGA|nr:conserved Plasmodium protein, unknown function [Plasmodium gallinaceum]CRG93225.1 conserved Plasmodium protein, unknown function [Plasmodium gallinaceum]